jgi:hypothetical protein
VLIPKFGKLSLKRKESANTVLAWYFREMSEQTGRSVSSTATRAKIDQFPLPIRKGYTINN